MSTITYERTEGQIEVDEEILARVKRGIALLEEQYGPGWVDKIDMNALSLSNGSRCILGQVYGNYGVGYGKMGLYALSDRVGHGFSIGDCKNWHPEVKETTWAELQKTWKHVLTPMVSHVTSED